MKRSNAGQLFENIPVKIITPVVLTVFLFVLTIFLVIIPRFENKLMEGKRELIHELTESAWSALNVFKQKEDNGLLTREEAQRHAIEHIRALRYGPELKDYFWINDMYHNIIMQPYRTDLEGKDISHFADPNGKLLFVEFVKTVQQSGSGYVDYQWQWKDDPDRIVPKISFVKGFEPWNWVIGTGIYVEDVRFEIENIAKNVILNCLIILLVIAGMSIYIIYYSIQAEKEKKEAEEQSRVHQEQLFQAAKLASVGTLVSGVAHEINNPITSVMLNIPILGKIWDRVLPILDESCRDNGDFKVGGMHYTQLRARVPLLLSFMLDGVNRVKTIVRDLKEFARENPSDLVDEVDVNDVVEKSIGLVGNMIKKSTDRFKTEYGINLPKVRGNSQRIGQVVINLLVNACQALQEKTDGITISTRFDKPSGMVVVEVTDQGIGITSETIKRVKDPFFTTKTDTGTGLGLAISDKIVRDHSGTLEINSKPGRGTSVQVSLPDGSATEPLFTSVV